MAITSIEWTATRRADGTTAPGFTFNPWRGCTKVSEGCKFCYAETLSKRNPHVLGEWGPRGRRSFASEAYWKQPLGWNAAAQAAGERRKVFCASLADVFEELPEAHPQREEMAAARARLFNLIQRTPHLDWLILTKRPQNIRAMLAAITGSVEGRSTDLLAQMEAHPEYFNNIWLGTSVENQAAADERIPPLLEVPAVVRFLSCEPLLGPVDLSAWMRVEPATYHSFDGQEQVEYEIGLSALDWVIAGGESGPGARPMHPDWACSLRDQCVAAGVAFHFKQWGRWAPGQTEEIRSHLAVSVHPVTGDSGNLAAGQAMARGYTGLVYDVGKKGAGRILTGRTWDEMPQVLEEAPSP